jgi:uncharacterized protein YndB with AHSA1/START domain
VSLFGTAWPHGVIAGFWEEDTPEALFDDVLSWVVIVLAVLAGLFVLIVLVGALLPRRHVAARTSHVGRPPEAVWEVLTDYSLVPTWHKEVVAIDPLPARAGRAVWRQTFKGNYPVLLEVAEATVPRHLAWVIGDEKGPFRGRWDFKLEPADGGCRVILTERGEIPNPFYRFMARLLLDPAKYLERYLQALVGRLGGPAADDDDEP